MIEEIGSQWCLVGNIAAPSRNKEESQVKVGTKHFSVGTRVYCLPAQWGDGYEKIVAIGRHRGSQAFVCMVISSACVAGWRAKVIYSPAVLRLIAEWCNEPGHRNWSTRAEVDAYVQVLCNPGNVS
jgi:hypothetical protein